MSSIEEVSDNNVWAVYLKSESEEMEESDGEKNLKNKKQNERQEEPADSDSNDGGEAAGTESVKSAKNASMNSLPEKSKEKYESLYNSFLTWKNAKGSKPLSQKTLLEYFMELAKEKKPSTLWAHYFMLKSTIYSYHKVDISGYKAVIGYLKGKSIGYKGKTAKTLTASDIEKFLKEAPDSQYLATKVALIFGIIGECKKEEFCNITTDDIEDTGSTIIIKIANASVGNSRSFRVTGKFYHIFKKYAALRPTTCPTNRFFLNYQQGKCTQQAIGIKKFGSMPKQIARFLNLEDSDSYTAHSFRRTSVKLLADWGATAADFDHRCGCKFNRMAESCRDESIPTVKAPCEKRISDSSSFEAQADIETPPWKRRKNEGTPDVDPLIINSNECTMRIENVETIAGEAALALEGVGAAKQSTSCPNNSVSTNNITPSPPSQQQSQPKTIILRKIPVKIKKALGKTITVSSGQPTSQPVPVVTPHQPKEVCLKWNNHHTNMQNSFPSLLDSEDFVDVTLACEGKFIKCHKVILSSCSDYLATLLRENPCQHPIILMKDLEFWQVETLITFMYRGEVNISHEKLPELLKAAESLQVKGLAGPASQLQKAKPQVHQAKIPSFAASTVSLNSTHIANPNPTQSPLRCTLKRSLESKKEPREFVKTRLRDPKMCNADSDSPEIKLERLNVSMDRTVELSENETSPNPYCEDLEILHKDNDPGGQQQRDAAYTDGEFGLEIVEDETDFDEEVDFVATDLSEVKQEIVDDIDCDSSKNSTAKIKDIPSELLSNGSTIEKRKKIFMKRVKM